MLLALAGQIHAAEAPAPPGSFGYVLQADAKGKTRAEAVAQLAASGRDWIVLDARFGDDAPWERAELDAIRAGRAGRKVVAYISIGEAEEYRPYWRKAWGGQGRLTAAAPAWLGVENPEWQGNYRVKYWQADWQKLILAAVDDAMERGFDGVYLDIVDGFETFEKSGAEFLADRVNPETKQSYRRDMVAWVKAVAARARAKDPAALVIPQNGAELLAHADFLAVVSAIGIEDLFTEGNKLQPAAHTREVLRDLQPILAAKKPVLAVEYPTKTDRRARAQQLAAEHGLIWLVTDRELRTLGTSGR